MQERLDYHNQQKQLPSVRDVKQEEQRLSAEIAGLERSVQYKHADLKVTICAGVLSSQDVI